MTYRPFNDAHQLHEFIPSGRNPAVCEYCGLDRFGREVPLKPKFEDQSGRVTPSLELPEIRKLIEDGHRVQHDFPPSWANSGVGDEAYAHPKGGQWDTAEKLAEHRAAILAEPHKQIPLHGGCFKYFGDALMAVAELSALANEKHNPGQPLGWTKGHSNKHLDSAARHMLKAGEFDSEWLPKKIRHSTLLAWRALANLQIEIENDRNSSSSVP